MTKRICKEINGLQHWQCRSCEQWFTKDNFYKDTRTISGLKSHCKKCHVRITLNRRDPIHHRIKVREWQRSSGYGKRPEVMERERKRSEKRSKGIKAKCRMIFQDAIDNGIIVKPDKCSDCASTKNIQGHHWSYYRPLEVKWLCPLCHAEEHRKEEAIMLQDRIELRKVEMEVVK